MSERRIIPVPGSDLLSNTSFGRANGGKIEGIPQRDISINSVSGGHSIRITSAQSTPDGSTRFGVVFDRDAFWSDHNRRVQEHQQARWEKMRESMDSRDAYLGILERSHFPRSSDIWEIPSTILLPVSLSGKLSSLNFETIKDGRERGQLIGWNPQARDFQFGREEIGTPDSVRIPFEKSGLDT